MMNCQRKCSFDGCTTIIRARNTSGLCGPHYRQVHIKNPGSSRNRSGGLYLVKSSVVALHKSESGLSMAKIDKGPTSYAQQLARYIRDPSTIRARTMNEWGRAPTLDAIKGFIADHQAERDAFRAEADSLGEHEKDEADFVVRPWADVVNFDRAVRQEKKAAAEFVVPEFVTPTPRFGPLEITAGVAALMKCTVADIRGTSRNGYFVKARQVVCHVLRKRGLSYNQIGAWLNRDHTTIMHTLNRYEATANERLRWIASQFDRVGESEAA